MRGRERAAWRAGPAYQREAVIMTGSAEAAAEGRDGTSAAAVMRVTSMRRQPERLGMDSAPHSPSSVSARRAESTFTPIICVVSSPRLCIHPSSSSSSAWIFSLSSLLFRQWGNVPRRLSPSLSLLFQSLDSLPFTAEVWILNGVGMKQAPRPKASRCCMMA